MESSFFKNEKILKLIEKYKTIWALGHLAALAGWDMNTYMPEEGAASRGEALAKISSLAQDLFLQEDFVKLIKQAENEKDLNDYEKAIVRMLKRSLKSYQSLPKEFIEEFARVTSEAHLIWKNAREKKDFSIFAPSLQKIVELSKKRAEYLGYTEHPYDALLDDYEEGLKTSEVETYFNSIKQPIIDLMKKIVSSQFYKEEHKLENEKYEKDRMAEFNDKLLKLLHYNLNHLRLDVSPHPFSTEIGPGDWRITTRYEGEDFAGSYRSVIHEYGHALYNLQSDPLLFYSPISGGSSLVLHESQSRFWENFLGRSREFIEKMYQDIIKINPDFKKYSVDEIYDYMNIVKPSLIRVEADEVSYHLHVLIRFEIEKALIEGTIQVKDLPIIWNDKYEKYLGIRPGNDSEGVLQDIHWSQGSIGYFPTYSFGTALSAMWKESMEKDLGKMENLIEKGEIKKIQDWLKENIHKYGSTYTFNQLVKKTTGKEFSSSYLLKYLEQKYGSIYKIK